MEVNLLICDGDLAYPARCLISFTFTDRRTLPVAVHQSLEFYLLRGGMKVR